MDNIDDRHEHFVSMVEIERLLDQLPFALERRALELDSKYIAKILYGVGVGM